MKNQSIVQRTGDVAHFSTERESYPAAFIEKQVGVPGTFAEMSPVRSEVRENDVSESDTALNIPVREMHQMPPPPSSRLLQSLSPFWHDRLIEASLILSMGLYYVVGNPNLGAHSFLDVPPYLYSLPFLGIFAVLVWYRLSFAVALLPLALPYYMLEKTVFSSGARPYNFSMAEIVLAVCVVVAVSQWLMQRGVWRYHLSWKELRDLVGPFAFPILLFVAAALISIWVALSRSAALDAFRKEVFDPLLYILLAFCCLRSSRDMKRLLLAFLGSALLIAFIGLAQYFFFANQLHTSLTSDRVHAVYGSANSIGLFFDYVLPIGIALFVYYLARIVHLPRAWKICLVLVMCFIPLVGVLFLSQSLGTALSLPIALVFILFLSTRHRRAFLIGLGIFCVLALIGVLVFHAPLMHFIENWHENDKGVSTTTKRYYLWQAAWNMIRTYPIFGVGMDNWLCHYSYNSVCPASLTIKKHFLILYVPGSHTIGTGLAEEKNLSHPHDVFLHVWVSIGIFGLLAFVAVLALFYWLLARVLKTVRQSTRSEVAALEWLVVGVGGALLAAMCQGLIDSAFLEQDLAFCFWMLVAVLLILRALSGTPWRQKRLPHG